MLIVRVQSAKPFARQTQLVQAGTRSLKSPGAELDRRCHRVPPSHPSACQRPPAHGFVATSLLSPEMLTAEIKIGCWRGSVIVQTMVKLTIVALATSVGNDFLRSRAIASANWLAASSSNSFNVSVPSVCRLAESRWVFWSHDTAALHRAAFVRFHDLETDAQPVNGVHRLDAVARVGFSSPVP